MKGLSALHLAADRGFLDLVKYLVEKNADKTCLDSNDMTPLDYAIACNHDEVIQYLQDSQLESLTLHLSGLGPPFWMSNLNSMYFEIVWPNTFRMQCLVVMRNVFFVLKPIAPQVNFSSSQN